MRKIIAIQSISGLDGVVRITYDDFSSEARVSNVNEYISIEYWLYLNNIKNCKDLQDKYESKPFAVSSNS